MRRSVWWVLGAALGAAPRAGADPCGLVPPARLLVETSEAPIERIGIQQTWVFYRDGVQTIAIRPGFEGRADEFGMLVPLPSPPALRKVPDALFDHLANVVQPPRVQVQLHDGPWVLTREFLARIPAGRTYQAAVTHAPGLSVDTVRVLAEEAVGQYEVAILQAGSPQALQRWMTHRAYAYPRGMDQVVLDYVERGWVFAAVKAKIGTAAGAGPLPGQRTVDNSVAPDAHFSGFVQGMAFRFEVDEAVVPMRLSTFNGDDAHNRLFILTDEPVRVAELPERLVVRQLSGAELHDRLTGPLQLEVTGGAPEEIPEHRRPEIAALRDADPLMWSARELIAADLQAAQTRAVSLESERWETRLLNVSAALGLKGPDVDAMQRDVTLRRFGRGHSWLELLDGAVLTVIDGALPAEVLRRHDLHLAPFTLPPEANQDAPWPEERLEDRVLHVAL